jgi:hypothetical protein
VLEEDISIINAKKKERELKAKEEREAEDSDDEDKKKKPRTENLYLFACCLNGLDSQGEGHYRHI